MGRSFLLVAAAALAVLGRIRDRAVDGRCLPAPRHRVAGHYGRRARPPPRRTDRRLHVPRPRVVRRHAAGGRRPLRLARARPDPGRAPVGGWTLAASAAAGFLSFLAWLGYWLSRRVARRSGTLLLLPVVAMGLAAHATRSRVAGRGVHGCVAAAHRARTDPVAAGPRRRRHRAGGTRVVRHDRRRARDPRGGRDDRVRAPGPHVHRLGSGRDPRDRPPDSCRRSPTTVPRSAVGSLAHGNCRAWRRRLRRRLHWGDGARSRSRGASGLVPRSASTWRWATWTSSTSGRRSSASACWRQASRSQRRSGLRFRRRVAVAA